MEEGRIELISDQTCQELKQLFSGLSSEQRKLLDEMTNEILSNISQYTRMPVFLKSVQSVEAIFLKKVVAHSEEDRIILKRALMAKLALHLPALVVKMGLPANIAALYPDAIERLADFLKNTGNEPYDLNSDFFCKDVRYVLGLSIPFGGRLVDINSRIALLSVILSAFRARKIDGIIRYFRAGGTGLWFRGHVDSRYLVHFSDRGTVQYFLQVAELLEQQKFIKGYAGSSWFYDPQLLRVSPHLAFRQECPREGGAFFLRHGTQSSDIGDAIKTSETRRRLYKEGKYIPVCYTMLWPRKELITWAKKWRASSHD